MKRVERACTWVSENGARRGQNQFGQRRRSERAPPQPCSVELTFMDWSGLQGSQGTGAVSLVRPPAAPMVASPSVELVDVAVVYLARAASGCWASEREHLVSCCWRADLGQASGTRRANPSESRGPTGRRRHWTRNSQIRQPSAEGAL